MDPIIYTVWLAECLGVEYRETASVFSYFGTAENLFRSSERELRLSGLLNRRELNNILKKDLTAARTILSRCQETGCRILGYDGSDYPLRLRAIEAPPVVLYVQGQLPPDEMRSVAIVGTRHASPLGKKLSFQFAYRLSGESIAIISGGAEGVDTHAHLGALQAGGTTVCVLGCGLTYPYQMKAGHLRREIVRHGALISEYSPNTPPSLYTFPKRNRIISALSDCTLVVEADLASGSLITAADAAKEKKRVFAVPGSIQDRQSAGTNFLLRNGAYAALDDTDILRAYHKNEVVTAHHMVPYWEIDDIRNRTKKGKKHLPEPASPIEPETERRMAEAYASFVTAENDPLPEEPAPLPAVPDTAEGAPVSLPAETETAEEAPLSSPAETETAEEAPLSPPAETETAEEAPLSLPAVPDTAEESTVLTIDGQERVFASPEELDQFFDEIMASLDVPAEPPAGTPPDIGQEESEKPPVKKSKRKKASPNSAKLNKSKRQSDKSEVKIDNFSREQLTGITLSVYDTISDEPISPEQIAQNLDMDVGDIISALSELELYGYIKAASFRRYIRT